MGISCSCPLSKSNDLESEFESIKVRSISFGGNDKVKTATRSISFNNRYNLEPTIMKSVGAGIKMTIEGSISFKMRENETMISIIAAPTLVEMQDKTFVRSIGNDRSDPDNLKHEAAVTLQKVYKSFRVRRKIADCAVQLVEQRWWQLLDYAELKRSSVSIVELDKEQETAISKWSRAKIRAAKVGKGLSKNGKAQKLALQHWLEAIDPRHRYGHNLQFYYAKWLNCHSTEHFFYWLDIGEGKEVNLVEKCPRSKLQHQCIKYLGPSERMAYQVVVENGKLVFVQTGELVDTTGGSSDDKWIFVLCTSKTLYIGKKNKGTFQHSSFLAGGATMSAGRLVADKGVLKAVWPHSGHYQPTVENFNDFVSFLTENNVDLSEVKMSSVDEEDQLLNKQRSNAEAACNLLKKHPTQDATNSQTEETRLKETSHLTDLDIPNRIQLLHALESEELGVDESPFDGEDQEYLTPKKNLFDEEEEEEEDITEEAILQRIESFKRSNSYKLGKQLSRTWSSGTGTRIGCVREYPPELRIRALEHVNLSPRCTQLSQKQPSPFII